MRILSIAAALGLLFGCEHGLSLPSDDAAPEGPLELGKTPLRQRKSLIPRSMSGPKPPPPDPVFTEDRCNELQQGGGTVDGCVTDVITCGESIVGHTRGGMKNFDTQFYKSKFCTPDTSNHDGGDERVYRLVMPEGNWHAVVSLDTPCADLDVAAILWNSEGCPDNRHVINRCEMFPNDGTARETVELVSQHNSQWLIVVEGKDSEEGPFGLSVQCYPGLF